MRPPNTPDPEKSHETDAERFRVLDPETGRPSAAWPANNAVHAYVETRGGRVFETDGTGTVGRFVLSGAAGDFLASGDNYRELARNLAAQDRGFISQDHPAWPTKSASDLAPGSLSGADQPLTVASLDENALNVLRQALPGDPEPSLAAAATYAAFVVRQWHPDDDIRDAAQDKLYEIEARLVERGKIGLLPDMDGMSHDAKDAYHRFQGEMFPGVAAWQARAIRASQDDPAIHEQPITAADLEPSPAWRGSFVSAKSDDAELPAEAPPERPTMSASERLAAELRALDAEGPTPSPEAARFFGRD
jgi:hypothetical protein